MIASENYTSPAVLAAQGSVLTNKYAEGYPGRRYYGGCECVDVAERLAIDRACRLFGAEHANVQPHSGAQANMGVYFACLNPGDVILAMNLSHGGHLTHGMHLNFSGKLYKVVPYGVRKDGRAASTSTRSPPWPANTNRSWWWPAPAPTRGPSTSAASPRSARRSARC